MNSTSTVSLSFRYTERDYVRALRAHYAMRLRWRLDGAVAVFLIGVGIFQWRSQDQHWLALTCIILGAVCALMLVAAFTIIPPLVFRSDPKFREDYSLTFSDEGVHFRTAHIDSQLQWSMYAKALTDAHSYVLYYGERHFTVIPKRVFEGSDQQQAFEEMLVRHVPEIIRR